MPTTNFSVGDIATLNTDIRSIDVSGSNAAINTAYTITLTGSIGLVNAGTITDLLAINLPSGSRLTIDGNGFALDGGNATRGLFVYAGSVTVENLPIQNAHSVGGAGDSAGRLARAIR